MNHTFSARGAQIVMLVLLGVGACGGESADNPGDGSTASAGKSPETGSTAGAAGAPQDTAGTRPSTSPVSGEASGSAGKAGGTTPPKAATGGQSGASGRPAPRAGSTGATSTKGGGPSTSGEGGAAAGGPGRGGRGGAGGRPNTDGGAPAAGATSSSGAAGASTGSGSSTSAGCGKADFPAACSTKGSPCTLDVAGTPRTYYVYLPDNYEPAQSYPLVFQFHPMGGSAEQAIGIPSIRSKFPAIYVTPQGLTSGGNTGWPNTNGQDMAFTKAMLSQVQEDYCVDNERIFSTGFSYGGMMSFAIGCEMGDVFRAIAPMSGATYSGCKNGNNPIAMWGSHGLSDNVVPIADGRTGRDAIIKRNHCGTETVATTPSPCVSYQGCDSGYPTTWCEFEGSHAPPSFAAASIVDFFKQF